MPAAAGAPRYENGCFGFSLVLPAKAGIHGGVIAVARPNVEPGCSQRGPNPASHRGYRIKSGKTKWG